MKVLQVHNVQSAYGGVDEVIRLERAALTDRGHEVELFTVSTPDLLAACGQLRLARLSAWNTPSCRELAERIRAFQPNIVHYHTPLPLGSLALLKVARRLGVPSVGTSHSFRYSCLSGTLFRNNSVCTECVGRRFKTAGILHRCYRSSLAGSVAIAAGHAIHQIHHDYRRSIDRFLVMTDLAGKLLETEGVPRSNIAIKPNFSDDFGPADPQRHLSKERLFTYIGRLEAEKGILALVGAWERLAQPLVRLAIAGQGSLSSLVAERLGHRSDVEILGFQTRSQLKELLQRSHFLIFPSEWYEAGPTLAMMEAFSAGCPAITSDIGNFTDAVIDGKNGWHFRSGDSVNLQETLQHAATVDQSTMNLMSKHARQTYVDHFSEQVVVPQLLAIYFDLTGSDR